MMEPIVYIGIGLFVAGLFVAGLIGVAVMPVVRARAVRSTARQLEAAQRSIKEIQADKNGLRAEFAKSTRRFEVLVEELKDKITSQRVELSKKDDVINQLRLERNLLKGEVDTLATQVVPTQQEAAPIESQPLNPGPMFLPLDEGQLQQFPSVDINTEIPQRAQQEEHSFEKTENAVPHPARRRFGSK